MLRINSSFFEERKIPKSVPGNRSLKVNELEMIGLDANRQKLEELDNLSRKNLLLLTDPPIVDYLDNVRLFISKAGTPDVTKLQNIEGAIRINIAQSHFFREHIFKIFCLDKGTPTQEDLSEFDQLSGEYEFTQMLKRMREGIKEALANGKSFNLLQSVVELGIKIKRKQTKESN